MTGLADPASWGVTLHTAFLNGINVRWADTASSDIERARPILLFIHGWPESWFSWRHQLQAAHAKGYRGIAPDMRGYGGTDAPKDAGSYTIYSIAGDMLALLQHLGVPRVGLVGHDHGASAGWKLSLLHPDVFVCYVALSVPGLFPGNQPPVEKYRERFGDERKPESDPEFFYMLHHQLPNAAQDYAQDSRALFDVLYGDGAETTPPAVTTSKLFVDGRSECMAKRVPRPTKRASWMSEEEVEYYAKEFERAGWDGGLNWYRVIDMDWLVTRQFEGARVRTPVAFIAGSKDAVISMWGGIEAVQKGLPAFCEQLDSVKIVEGAGHWIQQECAAEVSAGILEFMEKHRDTFTT
uniref:AB hydrolase-1 domain-containing protein n=1 Tax=Noctiluca scintillans TaxID=2966 RepID=A0A7S1FB86_NOCSC|mmetsp:Transcript_47108/g.125164  ORF Transcript_47108/g.125164 Transcript_47108/m.125164 type:complete len:352 (+) Transcript_47108:62-1117(+)